MERIRHDWLNRVKRMSFVGVRVVVDVGVIECDWGRDGEKVVVQISHDPSRSSS